MNNKILKEYFFPHNNSSNIIDINLLRLMLDYFLC